MIISMWYSATSIPPTIRASSFQHFTPFRRKLIIKRIIKRNKCRNTFSSNVELHVQLQWWRYVIVETVISNVQRAFNISQYIIKNKNTQSPPRLKKKFFPWIQIIDAQSLVIWLIELFAFSKTYIEPFICGEQLLD